MSEKIRALLTREGVKARDFLDIFFISKILGIKPQDVESCVIKKINYALGLYVKYRTNLRTKEKLLEQNSLFEWGSEKELLLLNVNEQEFYKFIQEFTNYLKGLLKIIKKVN